MLQLKRSGEFLRQALKVQLALKGHPMRHRSSQFGYGRQIGRRLLVASLLLVTCRVALSQADGVAFPRATPGFTPKKLYQVDSSKAWKAAIDAINLNGLAIANANRDANQISTAGKAGPSEGGGVFVGKLVTQYRYVITFVAVSPKATQINVTPILEARRLAAGLGKALSGNNAVSDVNWIDATGDNPHDAEQLRNWMYEQIEQSLSQ
ncbi:hypothetical protein [Ramlibacter sp. AN1133]|uniref:hypothetical protein n=1 Tax=Ramlibacter sp. AN1133 TaxID=3133429 RepID=UPI0030BF6A22